jgi:hypothetical protein
MFRTWMNTSSAGGTRSFGCWEIEAIVETGGRFVGGRTRDTCDEEDAEHD